ncbi:MAG TPA: glycoside hydrolase family 32 protein [Urbifossiella sp.]|jgi:fructan beta-fructosidase
MIRSLPLFIVVIAVGFAAAADRPDVIIADFEGDAYPAGWTTTGTAFGKGPASGAFPNQMPVEGFLGKGLVNSFLGGDDATGTLASPEFQIQRKYLNFLIGGGKHDGKTCINLLVNGKIVRTATGPNDRPGGSERLDWHTWDIGEFADKSASIQIVDEQKGGWGHINIDQIVQSDQRKQAAPARREFTIDRGYLHLPVKTGAPMRRMKFIIDNQTVREFDIELADDGKPQFWAFAEVDAFKGKKLIVETMLPADSKVLDSLKLAADVPDAEKLYREKHRPLFHFTSRFGWLNDPNGLVYDGKDYHLFYQHNPFGVNWGNMHWGHAVSGDLVHWKELGIGLYPKKYGDMAFSGSAIVDKGNTSGWGTKDEPPLVLAYTSTARGECIAYSNDKGRTWTEYGKNPVVKHSGRDPKLVWYEKGKHWVMAVYDEYQGKQWIAFHTSPDLKTWTFASRIEGFFECPDLFEMPVFYDTKNMKWVLYAADGKYLIGDFNGKEFKSDFKKKKQLWYGNFYAAQSFENTPRDQFDLTGAPIPRRIQIGWANGVSFPGMPFNQQMTFPIELIIDGVGDGEENELALRATPISELYKLYDGKPIIQKFGVESILISKPRILAENLDAFEMHLWIDPVKSSAFTINLCGTKLICDVKRKTLTGNNVSAPLPIHELGFEVDILVDRGSIEVFANGGRVAMSIAAIPEDKNRKIEIIPKDGEIKITDAFIQRMKSAWMK